VAAAAKSGGHAARAHVELAPSKASQWLNCPGSILLSRGVKDQGSWYADEGTAAHELGEKCLRSGTNPHDHLGLVIKVKDKEFTVDSEMAENVCVYVNHVRSLQSRAGLGGLIEARFYLDKGQLNPPGPMGGTSDFTLHDPKLRRLDVVDLKYGAGTLVEVNNNPQLRYYALAAVDELKLYGQVDEVHVTIVQPRADHPDGPVRTEVLSIADIIDFSIDLLDGAHLALTPNAPLKTGSHCKFCKASAQCPAKQAEALAVLEGEFELDDAPAMELPDPRLLPIERLASYLDKFDILDSWMKNCWQVVFEQAQAGVHIPGKKLVAKKANRKWAVSEEDVLKLARKLKFGKKEIYDSKLRSPAQLEKVFGPGPVVDKKKTSLIPSNFVKKESSGVTLVSVDDPRPAVNLLSAADDFSSAVDDDLL
jgi:hypothetical protein